MTAGKRSTTTAVVAALLLATMTTSQMVQSPMRLRVNSELLKDVFHKKDQRVLELFEDLKVSDYQLGADHKIRDIKVTISPVNGKQEDFDYNLSLDTKTFVGVEGKGLQMIGSGKVWQGDEETGSGEDFSFQGPISDFRLAFDVEQDTSGFGKKMNFKAFELNLDLENTKIESANKAFEDQENKQGLLKHVSESVKRQIEDFKKLVEEGDTSVAQKLPIISLAPVLGLYLATYASEKVEFSDKFVEYDFSPLSTKFVTKLHEEFLRPIKSDFIPNEDGEEQSALQMIIDENFINGIVGGFLKIDKMYSLREFLNTDPRFMVFKQLLTSTTLGMVIPSFKEEYGDGRPLDVVGTVSHDFMTTGLGEDVTPSGFHLEKNGNFALTVNLGAQLVVENKKGIWEDGRTMYMTLQIKGKMFVADAKHENRTFVVLPKGVNLSQLKILRGETEQFLEQMLLNSMLGYQLDQMKKAFQPMIVPLKKFPNPPELSCFGFNLTNLAIKVNKGFLQINANYIKVEAADEQFCEDFEAKLQKSPQDVASSFSKLPGVASLGKNFGLGGAGGGLSKGLGGGSMPNIPKPGSIPFNPEDLKKRKANKNFMPEGYKIQNDEL